MEKELILLVEDNEKISAGNKQMLIRHGYAVETALTLEEARAFVKNRMPDMIVLDIMLPDGSGLDFMEELRRTSDIPILLLTGLTTPEDVVRGLSRGGDDYLSKPYDFSVLLARIKALLRRANHVSNTLTKGDLHLDISSSSAFIDGKDLLLTKKEFTLLLLLLRNEGVVLSGEYIYETVWKQTAVGGHTLKTTMSRLRKKLSMLSTKFEIEYCKQNGGYIFKFQPH